MPSHWLSTFQLKVTPSLVPSVVTDILKGSSTVMFRIYTNGAAGQTQANTFDELTAASFSIESGLSKFLRKVGSTVPNYTTSCPRSRCANASHVKISATKISHIKLDKIICHQPLNFLCFFLLLPLNMFSLNLVQQPNVSQGRLIVEVPRSHRMTHHSRWVSSGRVIGSSQRQQRQQDLTTHNTYNRQTSMPPGGIRIRNPSRRSAVDTCLRPLGHWDRHLACSLT